MPVYYRWVAAASGSNNVVVALANGDADKCAVGATSYAGVNQAKPIDIGNVAIATRCDEATRVDVQSEEGDLVQAVMASIASGSPATVGSEP